jgi:hypothetical protein
MPAPLNPNLWPSVLHDQDANPITPSNPLPVTVTGGGIGTVISTPADTTVASLATQALPAPPAGTKRMRVQVTGGDGTTRIRIREVGGAAGTGVVLILLGSTMYGGDGGSIAALEAENVAGPNAAVMVQFEE